MSFVEDRSLSAFQVLGFMIDFYGYNLPLYFSQLGGPVLAIAAAFTLGNMLRNNEMTALIAAGMPLQRLAAPILVCSVVIVVAWEANKEFVIPRIAHKIARQRDDIAGTRTEGVYMVRDGKQAILTAQRLDPRRGILKRLQILVPSEAGRYDTVIDADGATYDADRQTWVLDRGRYLDMDTPMDSPDAIRWQPIAEYPFARAPEELTLFQRSGWAEMLSLRQMNTLVNSGGLPNVASIIVNRHIRLTQPLLYLVLVLLTLPSFLTREPGNVIGAGARALVLCGVYLGLAFIAHGIVSEQGAALRVWSPILCFGPLSVALLANVRT